MRPHSRTVAPTAGAALLFLVIANTVNSQGIVLQSEENPANGHIYHLLGHSDTVSGLSWPAAEELAVSLGGHLVTINNAAENAWVGNAFPVDYVWNGLKYEPKEGGFVYSSGENVSYRNWGVGEPNNWKNGTSFAAMHSSGFWYDAQNVSNFNGFPIYGLAEVEPPPEPRPVVLGMRFDGDVLSINAQSESPGFYRLMQSRDLITWTPAGFTGFVGGYATLLHRLATDHVLFFRLTPARLTVKQNRIFVQIPVPLSFGPRGAVEVRDSNGNLIKRVERDETGVASFMFNAAGANRFNFRFSDQSGQFVSPMGGVLADHVATPDPNHDKPIISGHEFPACVTCVPCTESAPQLMLNRTATPMTSENVRWDGTLLYSHGGPNLIIPFGGSIVLNHWFHSNGGSNGPFGRNVSADFDLRICRTGPTTIVLVPGNNQRFTLSSSDGGSTFWNPGLPGLFVAFNAATCQFRVKFLGGMEIAVAEAIAGAPGHVLWTRNANGITVIYDRDECEQVRTIRNLQSGGHLAFVNTANPHVKSVTDHLGRTWDYSYSATNQLEEITGPATEFEDIAPGVLLTDTSLNPVTKRRRTTFAYGDARFPNNLTSITDERGAVTRAFTYDAQGRVSTQTVNGHTTQYIYEPIANPAPLPKLEPGNLLTRVIDPEGNIVDTEVMGPGAPGQFGIRRRVTWTESGKGNAPLRAGEPLYYEQRWLQDCNCLAPVKVTQPFSSLDKPSLVFDANGIPQNWPHTIYTYNSERQVIAEEYTDGTNSIRTESTYQPNGYGVNNQYGKLLTRTDPRAFDSNPIYAGLDFTHLYQYDSRGNMTGHSAPAVTRGVAGQQAPYESWTHNQFGQVLTHTDPNGNITVNTYHSGPVNGGNINTKGNFFGFLASVTRGAVGSTDPAVNLKTSYLVNALGQVTRMIDPRGFHYDTEYNDLGEVVWTSEPEVSLPNGPKTYKTHRIYDGAGNVVMTRRSNIDYKGVVAANAFIDHSMSYDSGGNRLAERREVNANDGKDIITSYAYDRNNQLVVVQMPEGNRAFSIFDERRMLFKQFNGVAPGAGILDGYPADKRAVNLGGTSYVAMTRTDYDSRGNPEIRYDGRGNSIISGFDFRNRPTYQTDQNRNGSVPHYDDAGNVLATEQGPITANGVLTQVLARSYARFDEIGRQYQTVHDLNPMTSELGLIDPANPENSNFLTRHDAGSRVRQSIDARGNATLLTYDAANRRVTVTDALGNTVATTYDNNSNVIQLRETEHPDAEATGAAEIYLTTFSYDELNRRRETHVRGIVTGANPNGSFDHRAVTSYDSRGNAVRTQDPQDNYAVNSFDDHNRLTGSRRYNAASVEQRRVEFTYDKNSRKTEDIAYSDLSNAITLMASEQITRYAYDHANQKIREVYPDSDDPISGADNGADGVYDRIEVAFDAHGNPISVKEQRGVVFTNTFDAGNRLRVQAIALAASVPGVNRLEFDYDPLNRLTSARNNYTQVIRQYDFLSRQEAEIQSIRLDGSGFTNGWEQPVRVACAFDKQSNDTGCTVTHGGNTDLAITRSHDALNRVEEIHASYFNVTNRLIADYNYFGGRVQTKTLGNGVALTNTYDTKRRISAMDWRDTSNNLLVGAHYGYSSADNVLYERFPHDGGRYDHFGYNDRYELTHVTYRSASPAPPASFRDTFAYDDNYNRETAAFGDPFEPGPSVTDTYAANAVNEYTSILRNGQSFAVQHDAAGNMTRFPVRPATNAAPADVQATARWDAFNCLFDIDNAATGQRHYRYDAFRRRVVALDSLAGLQGSRRFIYHGWSDIQERVFNPGSTLANGPSSLERIYVEGPRMDEHLLAAIDRNGDGQLGGANLKNVHEITADWEYFFMENRLGSTLALSDADARTRVSEYYRHTVYGETFVSPFDVSNRASKETGNVYFFTGRRFDDSTGLLYFRNRYYVPQIGSFTSRDPKVYRSSFNLGTYANARPIGFIDPLGLEIKRYRNTVRLWDDDLVTEDDWISTFDWDAYWQCDSAGLRPIGQPDMSEHRSRVFDRPDSETMLVPWSANTKTGQSWTYKPLDKWNYIVLYYAEATYSNYSALELGVAAAAGIVTVAVSGVAEIGGVGLEIGLELMAGGASFAADMSTGVATYPIVFGVSCCSDGTFTIRRTYLPTPSSSVGDLYWDPRNTSESGNVEGSSYAPDDPEWKAKNPNSEVRVTSEKGWWHADYDEEKLRGGSGKPR